MSTNSLMLDDGPHAVPTSLHTPQESFGDPNLDRGFFLTVAGPDGDPYPSPDSDSNTFWGQRLKGVGFYPEVGHEELFYEVTSRFVLLRQVRGFYIPEGNIVLAFKWATRWHIIDTGVPG